MRTLRHSPASSLEPSLASDPTELEQVYDKYLDPIYRFLYARVGNREDAEDLSSQVFLKASRQLDPGRAERSMASWLFTVARTVLADHWRQQYSHGPMSVLDESVIDRAEVPDMSDDAGKVHRVNEILALLPARYREVLELRFLHGYTIAETARALGITLGNVKVIQHRALAKAAEIMEARAISTPLSATEDQAIA